MLIEALFCLTLALYNEARGEPLEGQRAVAHVIMNRAEGDKSKVCQVIAEKGQFPWFKTKLQPVKPELWEQMRTVAQDVLEGNTTDPTNGAVSFHAKSVRPGWPIRERKPMRIGNHVFFYNVYPIRTNAWWKDELKRRKLALVESIGVINRLEPKNDGGCNDPLCLSTRMEEPQ